MPKQHQASEAQMKKILNFAEHLRSKIIIPTVELQNFLNFQYWEMGKKSMFNYCTVQKISVSKSFKRAFRSMTRTEQAHHYSKCVKMVLKEMYSTNNKNNNKEGLDQQTDTQENQNIKKFEKLTVLIKKQGSFKKWIISQIQLAAEICVLRLVQSGDQLQLHHYILRESNSKNKQSLVLESTDEFSKPQTLRISNYNISYEELRKKLSFFVDKALQHKISSMMKKFRNSFTTSMRSSIQGEISLPKKQRKSKSFHDDFKQIIQLPATIRLVTGSQMKSMRRIIRECSKMSIAPHENRKIHSKIISHEKIFGLTSFKDFQQVSEGVFYNKKTSITRRIFKFDETDISYEWLLASMNNFKIFKKWKPSLFLANLLAEFPEQMTKIYHEINMYKDYNEVDYLYLRHFFEIDGVNYYLDKSINTQQYARVANSSRGWIENCIWRFTKSKGMIEVFVQIEFGGNFNKKNALQMGLQFIGEVSFLKKQYEQNQTLNSSTLKTVYNNNLFLFEGQSQFNAESSSSGSPENKLIFGKNLHVNDSSQEQNQANKKNHKNRSRYGRQQISFPSFLDKQNLGNQHIVEQDQESEFLSTQFYSIEGSDSDESGDNHFIDQSSQPDNFSCSTQNNQLKMFLPQVFINESQMTVDKINLQLQNPSLIHLPEHQRYLYKKHIVNFIKKNSSNKPKKSNDKDGHFLWRKEWKITDKGELININQQQIKVQSSVLKLVIKRMGRNLLSGKSILNVSLPIEIFGTDSNLERLCKSMAYGPRFLQEAARLSCPAQRMKRVICFALGYSLCYIEMQKPFNPILGETYQGVIDGCPVYGQQISHHPPISTVYFKGRGYTVYGNLEAKVQMGLNSASGINDGVINVVFGDRNQNQNVIKFRTPPGQISGLVMGDRKLTLTKKTFYIDQKNMILAIIQWGSQKKKNYISFNNDYFEGQILKLKPNTDLEKLDKIKEQNFQKVLSQIKGRWTGKVSFDEEVLFDVENDGPFVVEEEAYPLKSNVHFREDIILRKKNDLLSAQQAKQKLEQVQRNDRKLRQKYSKGH